MARKAARPAVKLVLTCSCGDSARGRISPVAAAIKMRDIFIRVHAGDGHAVTDTSTLTDQSCLLRQEAV